MEGDAYQEVIKGYQDLCEKCDKKIKEHITEMKKMQKDIIKLTSENLKLKLHILRLEHPEMNHLDRLQLELEMICPHRDKTDETEGG